MKKYTLIIKQLAGLLLLAGLLNAEVFAQPGQTVLPRVTLMPDLPSPYVMRDWKTIAIQYDQLIFSTTTTGQFLPVLHLRQNGVNYPSLEPILLDTYVGSATAGSQAEAINIIPALVGATLMGIDKSSQNGVNWTMKSKDFFNLANSQDVYLNGYAAASGSDWWYDLMPNIFFYQLYSQYPDIPDFEDQFISVADRWLEAVHAMGGATTPWQVPEMNYRAWKLSTMTPNSSGVKEPEAAGAIGWILYYAWLRTGDRKYLRGAELSMEFLSGLDANPSYELQLPYGAFVAAKMNAEVGTSYDVEKIVNWCFDRGPLRGWGVIAGTWNGSDVSGLIGEANDAGNDYAFAMNGFQQAAALVPMVKYDKRFAHDIAKWVLNLANASRLFYPAFLPEADQDDYTWSVQNDPLSVIAYEAVKESWSGKKLYGTGDAKRSGWAQTNLGIYGSSHVGYLAAIVESTDVEGILRLDVNKTDFFAQNDLPSFLVFNPHVDTKQITLALGAIPQDIYDAISETVVKAGVNGNTLIDVMSDQVMLLVLVPSGTTLEQRAGKLYAGETIVDHHSGYQFTGELRIKSLAASDTVVGFNQSVVFYSAIENPAEAVVYNWYLNGALSETSAGPDFAWTATQPEGYYTLKLKINSGPAVAEDSLVFRVVATIPVPPEITGFTTDSLWYHTGNAASVVCTATDGGKIVQYEWTLPGGAVVAESDSLFLWTVPGVAGLFLLSCEVTDDEGLKMVSQVNILVKSPGTGVTAPFAYYPLDGNVQDYSGNDYHATVQGALPVADARGEEGRAYRFTSGSDIISVANQTALNFQDAITISFWVSLDAVTQESFILSHGSWEERWKVSVTPENRLRWTIKSSSGIKDIDSSFPLELNHYYHFTVVYSGYSMEIYADGVLETFSAHSGAMLPTAKALTFGRKDTSTTAYSLKGSLDEIRIYDEALSPDEIRELPALWNNDITSIGGERDPGLKVYPNPSQGMMHISANETIVSVEIRDLTGTRIYTSPYGMKRSSVEVDFDAAPGIYIVRIETSEKLFYRKIIMK
jgi:hypothetical protein